MQLVGVALIDIVVLICFVLTIRAALRRIGFSTISPDASYRLIRLITLSATTFLSLFMIQNVISQSINRSIASPIQYEAEMKQRAQETPLMPAGGGYDKYRDSSIALLGYINTTDGIPSIVRDKLRAGISKATGEGAKEFEDYALTLSDKQQTARCLSLIGAYLYSVGQNYQAIDALRRAIEYVPFDGRLINELAASLSEQNDMTVAEQILLSKREAVQLTKPLRKRDLAWIYAGLGSLYSYKGNIKPAEEAFETAFTYMEAAILDKSLSSSEAGSISNDGIASAMRSRNLGKAVELACSALSYFSSDDDVRSINARINLSSVLREQGRIGDAIDILKEAILRQLRATSDLNLSMVARILLGHSLLYAQQHNEAEASFAEAESFFLPRFQSLGAYAQRLGRISQLRSLQHYMLRDYDGSIAQASIARSYFDKSGTRYDLLDVLVAECAAQMKLGHREQARASITNAFKVLRDLGLQDSYWAERLTVISHIISRLDKTNQNDVAATNKEIAHLFDLERTQGSYDVQIDIMIDLADQDDSKAMPDKAAEYRKSGGYNQIKRDTTAFPCPDLK